MREATSHGFTFDTSDIIEATVNEAVYQLTELRGMPYGGTNAPHLKSLKYRGTRCVNYVCGKVNLPATQVLIITVTLPDGTEMLLGFDYTQTSRVKILANALVFPDGEARQIWLMEAKLSSLALTLNI